MRLPITLCGAEVLARMRRASRSRRAIATARARPDYFGTALTLGYHRHPDPQAGEWIAAPGRPRVEMTVSATTKAPRVFFRGLKCPEGLVAILTNPGAECRCESRFAARFGKSRRC